MRVTLTFDNGPDPVGTPAVLRELADRGVPAIFFVVGSRALADRGLVEACRDAGHLVGNHTWSHSGPFGSHRNDGAARSEILRTEAVLDGLTSMPPLVRPVGADPGGVIDASLLSREAIDTLHDIGATLALWNVVPRDWLDPSGWVERAVSGCRAVDHAVVVLHDAHPAGMRLLGSFLDRLLDLGAIPGTDLPADCTPIVAGRPVVPLDPYLRPKGQLVQPFEKE